MDDLKHYRYFSNWKLFVLFSVEFGHQLLYDDFFVFLRKSFYSIIWMSANDLLEKIDFEIFS